MASARRLPRRIRVGSRWNATARSSSPASGVLSSNDRGRARRQRASTQPMDSIVSHCAPVRTIPMLSER